MLSIYSCHLTRLLFIVIVAHLVTYSSYATINNPQNSGYSSQVSASIDTTSIGDDRIIREISIEGIRYLDPAAISCLIDYAPGMKFDRRLTGRAIRQMYSLGLLRNITVKARLIGDDKVDLIFVVEEKPLITTITFKGNSHFPEKDLKEKTALDKIQALDPEEVPRYISLIKKLYYDKGYLYVDVTYTFTLDKGGRAALEFIINEGPSIYIRRILFSGNNNMRSKVLTRAIFSKETWVASPIDGTGIFHKERLNGDKYAIEQIYQNRGYLTARVTDVKTDINKQTNEMDITFSIKEGEIFTISSVEVEGNPLIPPHIAKERLPVQAGQTYSRQKIVDSIKLLEAMWGNIGYIFAQIEPSIIPNFNDNTVSVRFTVEEGDQIFLRKINIKGNKKTHDKVIRRSIPMEEGSPLTSAMMEYSKNRVESLGYFDQRDGVNWKVVRVDSSSTDKKYADLDLLLKETKTGDCGIQLSFGGAQRSISSPTTGLAAEATISDRNFLGTGIKFNLAAKFSKEEKNIVFSIANPWLFDRPYYGGVDGYHRRVGYDELNFTSPVNEMQTGGTATLGFMTGVQHELLHDIFVRAGLGGCHIKYEKQPEVNTSLRASNPEAAIGYQKMLDKLFSPGGFGNFSIVMGQDLRNHPLHPSRGHSWVFQSNTCFPTGCNTYGFQKFEIDTHWLTPLIGERDLVLHLRAFLGFVHEFNGKSIPYRDLFHIGGPASVRGFLFGQIGPQFTVEGKSDSIGGRKAFCFNAELLFPILPDFTVKGVCFYDGGTGWDTPFVGDIPPQFITQNCLDYRHAVGIGVRLLNPMPITIDWGFKLDPRKGETVSEVHFNMSYGW